MRGIVVFLSLLPVFVFTIDFSTENTVNEKINGKKIELKEASVIVNKNFRTLIPIHFITENLGARVDYANKMR